MLVCGYLNNIPVLQMRKSRHREISLFALYAFIKHPLCLGEMPPFRMPVRPSYHVHFPKAQFWPCLPQTPPPHLLRYKVQMLSGPQGPSWLCLAFLALLSSACPTQTSLTL